ncbi:amidohydrolase [Flavonifractor sp. An112]|uniref:amidohydrolase family protein n=1 Tax=Flavonifractor sp. An112 TaxID=1965544 RepID=UPI000B3ACC93|nr:amidohydrolase family protein [Flavonifractor sp. An112]OUQ59443.1 amidohydrolase [Flavonifractor sp. An112]
MSRKGFGRILGTILALTMLLSLFPASAAGPEPADSVYRNGNIYTVDEEFTVASAIAVKGDRLVYVGDEAGVEAYIGAGTKVVDLGGNTVIPGLIEGHMHINGLGESLLQIDAFWKPKEDILAAVKEAADAAQPGEWIRGRGWMNTVWEDSDYPTKEELDAVAPNNPVYLTRADGHMCWVNSMAFELAGITKDTPNPQGGEYLKTEDGELLGCVTDTAMSPISALLPAFSIEEQKQALLLAQDQLFSYGLTSAMNAGTSVETLNEVYKPLYEDGSLKLRVYILMSLSSTEGAQADYLRNNKPQDGLYNEHMDVRAVKLFSDGSLGARSAAMLEEYSDRAGHLGNYRSSDEEMYQLVKLAYDNGYQTGSHAIGDGANHQLLDAYERVMEENPREDPRLRIEHFQILTLEDIQRAIDMGVLPSMQTTHATSDMLMAEDRIGAERLKGAYAWRTIIDSGSIIINGSDAPVELVNPYHGLYAAVTRKDRLGEPPEGWHAEQCMTREEALRSFTIWAAYGEFNEDIKGSLEVGKLADFVVIDRDYMNCPAEDIKDIQVLTTVSGGEVVYTKDLSQPTIMWNGLPLTYNSKLYVEPGTIYVPLNDTVNGLSAAQTKADGMVTIKLDDQSVTLPVKTVDGVEYVGVRALFEGLGRNVTWYGLSSCVSVGWLK